MSTTRLSRSIPFWVLVGGSVVAIGAGTYLLVDKLGTMAATLTDGTATGVEVAPLRAQTVAEPLVLDTIVLTARKRTEDEATLRESLRLRPQVLRRLGWHYVRVHAFDLYSDPAGVAARIAAILGAPPETPTADTVTQPIDVLD